MASHSLKHSMQCQSGQWENTCYNGKVKCSSTTTETTGSFSEPMAHPAAAWGSTQLQCGAPMRGMGFLQTKKFATSNTCIYFKSLWSKNPRDFKVLYGFVAYLMGGIQKKNQTTNQPTMWDNNNKSNKILIILQLIEYWEIALWNVSHFCSCLPSNVSKLGPVHDSPHSHADHSDQRTPQSSLRNSFPSACACRPNHLALCVCNRRWM